MVKGIVAKDCENLVMKDNVFMNLDTAIDLDSCKNVDLHNNLVFSDEQIKNFIDYVYIKFSNDHNFPKNIPFEFIRDLLVNKQSQENSNLFMWLNAQGFNASWVVSTILTMATVML
ncbi:MAG: hypothetical protein ACRDD8_06835 [Bacteroidales bacterium]|uniref:hypothetical protein n=1 Tax=Cetobacterium sp. TaxID=2071632 RepID=UPI003EE59F51